MGGSVCLSERLICEVTVQISVSLILAACINLYLSTALQVVFVLSETVNCTELIVLYNLFEKGICHGKYSMKYSGLLLSVRCGVCSVVIFVREREVSDLIVKMS